MDLAGLEAGLAARRLPQLAAVRARGVMGWLRGAVAPGGPASSASLVTGVVPAAHGLWRGMEVWAGGMRPTSRATWKTAPLWERLERAGVSTGSVGWPGSRPGSSWTGLHVDEDFLASTGAQPGAWALPRRCAPAAHRQALRQRRVHHSQITRAMIAPLLHDASPPDLARDSRSSAIAHALAAAATTQAAATWMLEPGGPRPRAVFIHLPLLSLARRAFPGSSDEEREALETGAWRFLDAMIGRLCDLAGPEALAVIAGDGRDQSPGALLAAGPGVAPAARPFVADLLDVAPTLLAHLGMVDDALPGRPVTAITAPASGRRPAPTAMVRLPAADKTLLEAAARHGYRLPDASGRQEAQARAELAALIIDADLEGAAREAAAALEADPNNVLALVLRVRALALLGQAGPLPELAERLARLAPSRGWSALALAAARLIDADLEAAVPWLERAETDREVETRLTTAALWAVCGRFERARDICLDLVATSEAHPRAHLGAAMAASELGDLTQAEAHLGEVLKRDPGHAVARLELARVLARAGRRAEAFVAAAEAERLGASAQAAAAARRGLRPTASTA
jgi:tetratricopeptide (TPR) repeat protein